MDCAAHDPRLLRLPARAVRRSSTRRPARPELAGEIAELVEPTWIGADNDSWGLDHGTWSVLTHVFPNADVPVVQLAINAMKPLQYHFDLGRQLAALRERDVLVVGSGNVVHNLGLRRLRRRRRPARCGPTASTTRCATRSPPTPSRSMAMERHHDFDLAVPTPDHYIPMLYLAGHGRGGGGDGRGARRRLLRRVAVDDRRTRSASTPHVDAAARRADGDGRTRRCRTCPPTRPTCSDADAAPRRSRPVLRGARRAARPCCSSTAPARRSRSPAR